MSNTDIDEAVRFAFFAHLGQYRKCSPEKTNLYVSHPFSVMFLVEKFGGTKEDMIVACLHDVIEDCKEKGYDYNLISSKFGQKIADRVQTLTDQKVDPKTGKKLSEQEWKSRKKEIQLAKVKKLPPGDQLIKACDQLHNMSDYKEYSGENIFYREEYAEKAYMLIMACDSLPISLKAYARTIYTDAKTFFSHNTPPLCRISTAKFIRAVSPKSVQPRPHHNTAVY